MKTAKVLKIFFDLIIFLSLSFGPIGWFWLLVTGNWLICTISVMLILTTTKFTGIIQTPAHILLAIKINKNSTIKFDILFILALCYSIIISIITTTLIFFVFQNIVDDRFLFPTLLLSYSVSTALWIFWATKDIKKRSFDLSQLEYFLQESSFYVYIAILNGIISLMYLGYYLL